MASTAPLVVRANPLRRLQKELFGSRLDGLISIALLAALLAAGLGFFRWALFQAQWVVLSANSTLFAVGRYPVDQQWRLWLLTSLLALATGLSWGLLRAFPGSGAVQPLWPRNDRWAAAILAALALWRPMALQLTLAIQLRWWGIAALLLFARWASGRYGPAIPHACRRLIPLLWPLLYLVGMVLISGGLGLVQVPTSEWGGLLLTVLMATFAILLCFPLGVLLALGRRSELPLLRWGSVIYIEFIRGAPLITLLFLGQNILASCCQGGWLPIGFGGLPGCSPFLLLPMWLRRCDQVW